jgi:uncharacterized RDD family membrane protein YckC
MSCPQCGNSGIDAAGACLNCGCPVSVEAPFPKSEPEDKSANASANENEGGNAIGTQESPAGDDLPEWRKELAQRFQAIKQKRENKGQTSISREIPASAPAPKAGEDAAALRAELLERMKARIPSPKPPRLVPLQKELRPLTPPDVQEKSSSDSQDPQRIQSLIDTVVSRKAGALENAEAGIDSPIVVQEDEAFDSDSAMDSEGKLILLSRTLSGLVDLMLVVLFTGIFIVATDHFWGISVVDSISIVHFSLLFLLIYFVYSVFFLASANQTIGMMITELRVVGTEERRPRVRQITGRCCCFLLSLFGLGIGLLWGLFSRKNACLHDYVSGTYVVRI